MSGLVLSAIRRDFGCSRSHLRKLLRNAPFIIINRPLSSVKATERRDKRGRKEPSLSFTASYLVNSCGLSPESAKSTSRHVRLFSSKNPDSVVRLFKNYGFTDDQISKVVKKFPRVLVLDPQGILLPKLEFLGSVCFSRADTTKFVSLYPNTLAYSLKNRLIPRCDLLKSILTREEDVIKCLKRSIWLLSSDLPTNISTLRGLGVPESQIKFLFSHSPRVISCTARGFDKVLEKVIGFGMDPTKFSFVQAIVAVAQLHESNWDHKVEVFKSCGWSEEDVRSALKRYPLCMEYSEKKIIGVMDFLVNKIGLQPSDIAKNPLVFSRSLEKLIVPRCLRIGILLAKGFLKVEQVNYLAIFKLSEKQFLERFVFKYQKDIPQPLSVVQGKSVPDEQSFVQRVKELNFDHK